MYGDLPQAATASEPRRPRRIVAAVEVLLVIGLVVLAVWCYQRGTGEVRFTVQDSTPPLGATRFLGSWIGAALGLCALAGFFLLDVLRRLTFGLRPRLGEMRARPPRS